MFRNVSVLIDNFRRQWVSVVQQQPQLYQQISVAIVYYSEKVELAFRFQSSVFPNNIQLPQKSAGTVGVVAVCSRRLYQWV